MRVEPSVSAGLGAPDLETVEPRPGHTGAPEAVLAWMSMEREPGFGTCCGAGLSVVAGSERNRGCGTGLSVAGWRWAGEACEVDGGSCSACPFGFVVEPVPAKADAPTAAGGGRFVEALRMRKLRIDRPRKLLLRRACSRSAGSQDDVGGAVLVGSKLEGADTGTGRDRSNSELCAVEDGASPDDDPPLSSFDEPRSPEEEDPETLCPCDEEDA